MKCCFLHRIALLGVKYFLWIIYFILLLLLCSFCTQHTTELPYRKHFPAIHSSYFARQWVFFFKSFPCHQNALDAKMCMPFDGKFLIYKRMTVSTIRNYLCATRVLFLWAHRTGTCTRHINGKIAMLQCGETKARRVAKGKQRRLQQQINCGLAWIPRKT